MLNNTDNKTKILNNWDLTNYKELIEKNPCHIATVWNKTPNLSVASDIYIVDKNTILISNNEMIYTPYNITKSNKIVITSFSDKWAGLRLTGVAEYLTDGPMFDLCNKLFNNKTATPKGAIVIKVHKVEVIA